ncbi:MAG: CAP domain-containing protein [Kofleriaceae bacterium]
MRLWGMLLILLTCASGACGDDGGSTTDGGGSDGGSASGDAPMMMTDAAIIGEPPELAGITDAHNVVRAMVQTSTPLMPLAWSDALEATAKAYGMMCINNDGNSIMDHNPNRSAGHPYQVGENIYASGGTATAQGAVQLWAAEKANYVYPNGYSPATGHYTQIVWRTTREVGCALVNCPNIQFPSTIICDYGPAGNGSGPPY